MLGDQITTGSDIYLVRVVGQDGEVDYGWSFRFGIAGHKIPQGPHGLGTEMTSLDDVIVHDLAHSSWLGFSGGPVDEVNHSTEDDGIGHLTANRPGLYLTASQKAAKLVSQQVFYFADEICALIVENLSIFEGLYTLVFSISKGRVHDREQPGHGRGGLF